MPHMGYPALYLGLKYWDDRECSRCGREVDGGDECVGTEDGPCPIGRFMCRWCLQEEEITGAVRCEDCAELHKEMEAQEA